MVDEVKCVTHAQPCLARSTKVDMIMVITMVYRTMFTMINIGEKIMEAHHQSWSTVVNHGHGHAYPWLTMVDITMVSHG